MDDPTPTRAELRARHDHVLELQRRALHVLVQWSSTFGPGRHIPARIEDHRRGLSWHVTEVLEHVVHYDYKDTRNRLTGLRDEAVLYRLKVTGPLPRGAESGEQVVIVQGFDDGSGWYMRPDTTG